MPATTDQPPQVQCIITTCSLREVVELVGPTIWDACEGHECCQHGCTAGYRVAITAQVLVNGTPSPLSAYYRACPIHAAEIVDAAEERMRAAVEMMKQHPSTPLGGAGDPVFEHRSLPAMTVKEWKRAQRGAA